MTEQAFIDREQRKLDKRWLRILRAVKAHSIVSREDTETLLCNGLIQFGGPSETCRYNHDRLTESGIAILADLEAKH